AAGPLLPRPVLAPFHGRRGEHVDPLRRQHTPRRGVCGRPVAVGRLTLLGRPVGPVARPVAVGGPRPGDVPRPGPPAGEQAGADVLRRGALAVEREAGVLAELEGEHAVAAVVIGPFTPRTGPLLLGPLQRPAFRRARARGAAARPAAPVAVDVGADA